MSKDEDALFEAAMATLEIPADLGEDSGLGPLAAGLTGVSVTEVSGIVSRQGTQSALVEARQLEDDAFEQAMFDADISPKDLDEVPRMRASDRQANLRRDIRRGRAKPEVTLDLHGMTRDQAWTALEKCVVAARRQGHELALIICGQGLNSPGDPVLYEALQRWLKGPLETHVIASYPAARAQGGRGAWFLLLRRLPT